MSVPSSPSLMTAPLEKDDLTRLIAAGIAALGDESRLGEVISQLRGRSEGAARFAATLFDLEMARRGDELAKTRMKSIANQLLRFWSDGTGQQLSKENPLLAPLWSKASGLMISFELNQFREVLADCWAAREDAASLEAAVERLKPEGHRRVEFARCLYSLELARLGVDNARAAFSRRAGLLAEAYQSADIADELIGHNEGLRLLWGELVPYLDEFFEMVEEQSQGAEGTTVAFVETLSPIPSLPPPVEEGAVPTSLPSGIFATEIQRPDDDFVDAAEIFDAPLVEPPAAPAEATAEADEVWEMSEVVLEDTVADVPPPLASKAGATSTTQDVARTISRTFSEQNDYVPDAAATQFWRYAFEVLQLTGDEQASRSSQRLLSTESRSDRKRINAFLAQVGPFLQVPEARAFSCLLRLMMAGQLKEKSLFGAVNGRRAEAFSLAFGDLHGGADSAARAAVWFSLDGAETETALQRGLEGLWQFIGFCAREKVDPLAAEARLRFERLGQS